MNVHQTSTIGPFYKKNELIRFSRLKKSKI